MGSTIYKPQLPLDKWRGPHRTRAHPPTRRASASARVPGGRARRTCDQSFVIGQPHPSVGYTSHQPVGPTRTPHFLPGLPSFPPSPSRRCAAAASRALLIAAARWLAAASTRSAASSSGSAGSLVPCGRVPGRHVHEGRQRPGSTGSSELQGAVGRLGGLCTSPSSPARCHHSPAGPCSQALRSAAPHLQQLPGGRNGVVQLLHGALALLGDGGQRCRLALVARRGRRLRRDVSAGGGRARSSMRGSAERCGMGVAQLQRCALPAAQAGQ